MVMAMSVRTVRVQLRRHQTLRNLYMATSDDMPGLVVHGHSPDEIQEQIPGLIRDILEIGGCRVIDVSAERDETKVTGGFGLPAFIAKAKLEGAGCH